MEILSPERLNLQFLYRDERLAHFMPAETFEQIDVENDRLGRAAAFLTGETPVTVECVDGQPPSASSSRTSWS